jgi:outer membrane protein assembly factor BamB
MKTQLPARLPQAAMLLVLATLIWACGSTASSPGASAVPAATSPAATATPSPSPSPEPAATPAPAADWPVYHLDTQRSGVAPGFPALHTPLTKAWSVKLDAAVYAEPLVVGGRVIAATEGDSVYALDAQTGAVQWLRKLGTPVRLSTLPCGDIDPLGIIGTPAYDPQTGSIFMVGETTGPKHTLFALDARTGEVRWSRGVDLAGDDPRTHQQRTALAVANGYVYFGFGGLAGDCGQYVGEVIGVPTTGQGDTIAYRVPVKREGAVWATGGAVVDGSGNLYVATGNGSSTTKYDGSDSVIELSPDLKMLSRFAPSVWANDNARDLDLGSLSPTLLPRGYVFIVGKRAVGYVLRQGNLGGIGGQVSSANLGCEAFGGTAVEDSSVYVGCRSALERVDISADGKIKAVWKTSAAGWPPVLAGGAVWSLSSGGTLVALNPDTGATLASISVGGVPHFASPTPWAGLVFVGTLSGVTAVRA